jgi:hypothetical protein
VEKKAQHPPLLMPDRPYAAHTALAVHCLIVHHPHSPHTTRERRFAARVVASLPQTVARTRSTEPGNWLVSMADAAPRLAEPEAPPPLPADAGAVAAAQPAGSAAAAAGTDAAPQAAVAEAAPLPPAEPSGSEAPPPLPEAAAGEGAGPSSTTAATALGVPMEQGELEEEDPLIVAQREREAAERAKEAPAQIPPYDEEALKVGAGPAKACRGCPPQHLASPAATARAAPPAGCPLL